MRDFETSLTPEQLRERLHYDPSTGTFTWKMCQSHKRNRRVGRIAGTKDRKGYVGIILNQKSYRAHRLAWLYVHGFWPVEFLDHINRDTSDNRLSNLREASGSQNQWNRCPAKKGESHLKGTFYLASRRKWRSQITIFSKQYLLGEFDSAEAAHAAYVAAARAHFGEFARVD